MIPQMNTEIARTNMIKQQLRTWDVSDQAVLDVLTYTPREDFVPEAFRDMAFADIAIPLSHQQTLMTPKEEGRLLQSLKVVDSDRVLVIGVQTGYLLGVIAKRAAHVYGLEHYDDFRQIAEKNLNSHNLENVSFLKGDVTEGWQNHAPFNVIVLTGSIPVLDDSLLQGLEQGGRLYAVVGTKPTMSATLVTRVSENNWKEEKLFETYRPRTPNIKESKSFTF